MRGDDHQPRHLARPTTSNGRPNKRRRARTRNDAPTDAPTPPPPGRGRDRGTFGRDRRDERDGQWAPERRDPRDRHLVFDDERPWVAGAPGPSGRARGSLDGGGVVRSSRWWASDDEDDAPGPTATRPRNGGNDRPRSAARPEPQAAAGGDDGFDDGDEALGADDDGSAGGRERRLWVPAWVVPALLGVGAVAAAAGALLLDEHPTAEAVGAEMAPTTPVLSARRVPELLAAPVADRRLTTELQGWIAQSPPNSCLVVESGDRALFAHNPVAPVAGASTQKVVTASALLLALGPDARLETVVRAASEPSGGVVAGDLFVVGGGDPLLTSPAYAESMVQDPTLGIDPIALADAIVSAGITRIEGSVVGDGSRYDGQRYHPTWPDRFRANEAGPIGPLTVNDGRAGSDGRSRPPAGAVGDDPAANAAAVVTDLLRLRGVTVVGAPRTGQAPEGAPQVATFASPPVREIVGEMLADSDDDTAEMALKEVGHQESGNGSWEGGAAAATALLSEAGAALDGVQIVEGSGLSTANRLTCQFLVDLLTLPETGQVVADGLAVAGQTGTLQDRWNGTQVEGRLLGKTGTLNSVTALTGRVSPMQGGALMFAYVANVPDGQSLPPGLIPQQDTLGEILVSYPRGVDVGALLPALPAPTTGTG